MTGDDLLALIGRDTPLRKTSSHLGGEYSAPCSLCKLGTDRLKVWPKLGDGPSRGRWACLGPKAGRSGCDKGGDAIQYLRERDGISYREACERLGVEPKQTSAANAQRTGGRDRIEPFAPPNAMWQAHAGGWAARCAVRLWREEGARARNYLHDRGLGDDILHAFNVGYNPQDTYEEHSQWGLPQPQSGAHRIWIPRGVTFPWYGEGGVWRFNVRRPLSRAQVAAGETKYIGPAGFANALYNADGLKAAVCARRPVVLVEGEIDALTIVQALGDEVAAAATGSTAGSRRVEWAAELAQAPVVLVAFDWDQAEPNPAPERPMRLGAGEQAAAWWLRTLPNARRLRPLLHDVNSLPDPDIVRGWIRRALDRG